MSSVGIFMPLIYTPMLIYLPCFWKTASRQAQVLSLQALLWSQLNTMQSFPIIPIRSCSFLLERPAIERWDFQQGQDVISNRAKRVIWLHAVRDGVIANLSDNVGHKFRVVHAHSSFDSLSFLLHIFDRHLLLISSLRLHRVCTIRSLRSCACSMAADHSRRGSYTWNSPPSNLRDVLLMGSKSSESKNWF